MALEHHRPDRVAERREQDRARAEQLVACGRRRRCPTSATTPARPISSPASREPVTRSEASKRSASRATNSGAAAIRIAASDEATCCSPAAISGNGIAISTTAKTASQRQRPRTEASRPSAPGEREQHRRPEHHPHPGQEGGRDAVVDGDLDEQVRDPPEHRDGGERRPGAGAHARQPGAARPRITCRSTEPGAKTSTEYWTASPPARCMTSTISSAAVTRVAPIAAPEPAAGLDQPRPHLGPGEGDRDAALDEHVEHHLPGGDRLAKLLGRRQVDVGVDDVAHLRRHRPVGEQRALDQRRPARPAGSRAPRRRIRAPAPARLTRLRTLSRLPWRRASEA